MRYGIFSDIHSNLEAFEAVIKAYTEENIERYFCVGDIVGYAADPKECLKETKGLTGIIVAGNHDWAAVGIMDIQYFNPHAKEAVLWTKGTLDESQRYFLESLKLTYECDEFMMVHGTLDNPEEFKYILEASDAIATFSLMRKNICFIGHSHVPGIFIKDKDGIDYLSASNARVLNDKKYIVNVGSVGQPRDHDNRAAYCIYDTESKLIEIKRVSYNIKKAQEKIINAGLPSFLATRLSQGI